MLLVFTRVHENVLALVCLSLVIRLSMTRGAVEAPLCGWLGEIVSPIGSIVVYDIWRLEKSVFQIGVH